MRRLPRLTACIVFAITGMASSGSQAAGVDFYGIRIGEPPTIPECIHDRTANLCYRRDSDAGAPLGTEEVTALWDTQPSIANYFWFKAWLIAGRVERIVMETGGLKVQRRTFEELVAKFGRPATKKTSSYQNLLGARFESIEATWRVGSVRVEFVGLHNSVEQGEIRITSDAYLSDAARQPAPTSPKM